MFMLALFVWENGANEGQILLSRVSFAITNLEKEIYKTNSI